jgi:protein TonB
MKKKAIIIALVFALLGHVGIFLFGGLLFVKPTKGKLAATEDIELAAPDEPQKQEEKKEKEISGETQEQTEAPQPELNESAPLDLGQLELAMNPGAGDGAAGDFGMRMAGLGERVAATMGGAGDQNTEAVFSLADLDQAPRVVSQPPPSYPMELRRKKLSGTVQVMFIVDAGGRVVGPTVQKSADPAFDRPALEAVKKWRFEPGKRNGQAVQFKMRVPITFMAG